MSTMIDAVTVAFILITFISLHANTVAIGVLRRGRAAHQTLTKLIDARRELRKSRLQEDFRR
jgi:hypothetical protein